MRLKKKLIQGTIILPILFLGYIQIQPVKIYIHQIGINLYYTAAVLVYTLFVVIWLSCSSYRKACRHGDLFELCFNLFPIELLLFVVFAQWHFVWACILAGIAVLATIGIFVLLIFSEKEATLSDAVFKRTGMACKRFFVLVTCVIWLIPSILSVVVYKLEDPKYAAERERLEELLSAYNPEEAGAEAEGLSEEDAALFACFEEDTWKQYSVEERITILQEMVHYEARKLGMPTVEISTEKLEPFVQGQQGGFESQITIDLEHILNSPVEEVLDTCLHETYHAYQDYLVESIDWEEEYTDSVYFEEVRGWMDNFDNYVSGGSDFEAYESQPLEASARAYAEKEGEYILSFLEE